MTTQEIQEIFNRLFHIPTQSYFGGYDSTTDLELIQDELERRTVTPLPEEVEKAIKNLRENIKMAIQHANNEAEYTSEGMYEENLADISTLESTLVLANSTAEFNMGALAIANQEIKKMDEENKELRANFVKEVALMKAELKYQEEVKWVLATKFDFSDSPKQRILAAEEAVREKGEGDE